MAKITLLDGTVFEGTPTELVGVARAFEESKHVELTVSHTFKEGDKVRALADSADGDIKKGEIGVVDEIGFGDEDDLYDISVEGKDGYDYFRPQDLELISEEEAKADAEQRKRDAVFTDAGRKVGEFRKGDIVRVSTRADAHKVAGKLVTIAEFKDSNRCGGLAWFEDYGHSITGQYLEPIVFAESRLDRK